MNQESPFNTSNCRVLSLDGGGSKGVYTLGVLKEVEALVGAPLSQAFGLIYGTSTGSIIAALLALQYSVADIEKLYFDLIPRIMTRKTKSGRTRSLKVELDRIFGERDFSHFKTHLGIVSTNSDLERPMIFKTSPAQAHGRSATFKPGFGCKIADSVLASCAAYPFFEKVTIATDNQGHPLVIDGGYVANNPTLFAITDAVNALKMPRDQVAVLSIGVGSYNEPKRSIMHRLIFSYCAFRHIAKMFNISSTTVEQLRAVIFPEVSCIRISDPFPQPEYATDLLEDDPAKLRKLFTLGRESFAKRERDVKDLFKLTR